MSYLFRLESSKAAASLSFIDSCPRYGGRMVKLQEGGGSARTRVAAAAKSTRAEIRTGPSFVETSFLNVKRTLQAAAVKKTHFHHISRNKKITSNT